MDEIEYLRNEESTMIEWIIFCQNQNYTECVRMFERFLQEIRQQIKEFYEITILD